MSREEIINTLNKIRNEKNAVFIQKTIDKINTLDDSQLKELRITKPAHIIRYVDMNTKKYKFIALNDLISYGKTWNKMHIHVIPRDVHGMMNTRGVAQAELEVIDALEQLKSKIQTQTEHRNVSEVLAVSPIVAGMVAKIFRNLDFSVKSVPFEEAKHDKDLRMFYYRFKRKSKGKKYKYLGKAHIDREKLLSEEWEQLKEERKKLLLTKLEELDRPKGNKEQSTNMHQLLESCVEKEPTKKEIEEITTTTQLQEQKTTEKVELTKE